MRPFILNDFVRSRAEMKDSTHKAFLHKACGVCVSSPDPLELLNRALIGELCRAQLTLEYGDPAGNTSPPSGPDRNIIAFRVDNRIWGKFISPDLFISHPGIIHDLKIQALFCKVGLSMAGLFQGGFVLHASAVTAGGRTIAFMGSSGRGKTTILEALLDRGCGFIADDILLVWPGCMVSAGPLYINRCAGGESHGNEKQIHHISPGEEGELRLTDIVWLEGNGQFELMEASPAECVSMITQTVVELKEAGDSNFARSIADGDFLQRRKAYMDRILDIAVNVRCWRWQFPRDLVQLPRNVDRALHSLVDRTG